MAAVATMAVLSGCTGTSAAGAPPAAAPEVEVAPVEQRDVPVYREWIGTLDGMVNAAIRAEVTGYLMGQRYAEGSFVHKGQLLFEIDPRPFLAALDQAQGQLAQAQGQVAQAKAQLAQSQAQLVQAQANQRRTQLDVDRYAPLLKQEAVTQQDVDNATQNNQSAQAAVEAAKAQVETAKAQIQSAEAAVVAAHGSVEAARVNAGFTRLTSPIDGIAGKAQVQTGNLVSPSGATITTVSTLDPVKAEFTVSEQEYLKFRESAGGMERLRLQLILADGSVYPHPGKFMFADREVDRTTGAILLTGQFPNPGNVLRPGQYAKVRAAVETLQNALLVPQRAVTEMQGNYLVSVVDSQNKVAAANVKVGGRVGPLWIVTDGLKLGDRVIADGSMKVMPGMQVTPKPFVAGKGQ
jgi:membrane fusion protein (multidrug efflux system)